MRRTSRDAEILNHNGTAEKSGNAAMNRRHEDVENHDRHSRKSAQFVNLIFYAGGILLFYFLFGIMQEKVTKTQYGPDKEKFTYTQALVFVQSVVNAIFALAVISVVRPDPDSTPHSMYALSSFSYMAAMILSNHSLQFVSYPTQVLGKSCKPVPIMVFGVLFARKSHPPQKYAAVLMIVVGCAMFLYKDKGDKGGPMFEFNTGEVLLLLSLAMDGVTGAIQDRMRSAYKLNSHRTMFNMNLWCSMYLAGALVFTGEIFHFMDFCLLYPEVFTNLFLLSCCSALGQYCIFKTIEQFGPLTCSIVTTTRKFFTILFSVIWFGHPLASRQWLGTVLVFAGLAFDTFYGKKKPVAIKPTHAS